MVKKMVFIHHGILMNRRNRKVGIFNRITEGSWTYWHNNGKIKQKGEYQENLKSGLWTSWYDNGQKRVRREITP